MQGFCAKTCRASLCDGASDHSVSEAIYLRDPDSNDVELYWDKPKAQWPRAVEGSLAMFTQLRPRLVVCGHIHASAGQQGKIGTTPIVNAGPNGLIFEFTPDK
jgi:catechol-2,3-dioxygenase